MPRSLKKGPFVDQHLYLKVAASEREGHQERNQDLVASLDDYPRHARSHHRSVRRSQARAGVHHRVDGWSQAR